MKKAKIAGDSPQIIELEANKTYAWCACGKSNNQPWCDGSHVGSEFKPKIFKLDAAKKVALCMCKQTKTPPYCDGSHLHLA